MSSFRTLTHNIAVALTIALPSLIVAGALVTWWFVPTWTGRGQGLSLLGIAEGFLFWYSLLILPVIVGSVLHHLIVGGLTHQWPSLAGRTLTIMVSCALGAIIAICVGLMSTDPNWIKYSAALLIVCGTYGAVVRLHPRPTRGDPLANDR